MTIGTVADDGTIETAWGNSVATQLNALPSSIVTGSATDTTDGSGVAQIAHGLSFTPSWVGITPTLPSSGSGAFSGYAGVTWDGTNITINRCVNPTGSAITSSSVSFKWVAVA